MSTDNLAREYFGEQGMLGYVERSAPGDPSGIACAKHQNMAGSDIGDEHKKTRGPRCCRRSPQHDEPVRPTADHKQENGVMTKTISG